MTRGRGAFVLVLGRLVSPSPCGRRGSELILGAGISLAVKMVRRPPIVTPTHGAISQAVVALMERARWTR